MTPPREKLGTDDVTEIRLCTLERRANVDGCVDGEIVRSDMGSSMTVTTVS